MLAVALLLSTLIGVALGLLGGGGSILTVPVLLFALHLDPKIAIATSLLVVGATSAVAAISHARAGRVRWRTGLLYGVAGMAGAFGGGQLARFIPAPVLLLAFGGMMIATAVAMLRKGRDPAHDPTPAEGEHPVPKVLAEGALIGVITGLVGAGGGFLIVPALALLGRLPMREAVGTSLVVIAMKSLAGFAGYATHVSIDWGVAGMVTAAAIVGSLGGERLSRRLSPDALRQAFGWFVVAMAVLLIGKQLPASVRGSALFQALLVERWPWYAAGAAIGGFVLLFLWFDNKLLGVSTGCAELCQLRRQPALRRSWRPSFLVGIAGGGLIAAALAGATPTLQMGALDVLVGGSLVLKLGLLAGAGVLVGYGARVAGGCTSGHGIVGVAQLAPSSLVATGAFLVGGFATTALVHLVLG